MNKTLEIILILFFIIFSFFLGVKYSKNVKEYGVWIFEPNDSANELPELSNTENIDTESSADESSTELNTNLKENIQDQTSPRAEDQNLSIEEQQPNQ